MFTSRISISTRLSERNGHIWESRLGVHFWISACRAGWRALPIACEGQRRGNERRHFVSPLWRRVSALVHSQHRLPELSGGSPQERQVRPGSRRGRIRRLTVFLRPTRGLGNQLEPRAEQNDSSGCPIRCFVPRKILARHSALA